MLPVLFQLGPVKIYSMGVMIALSLFVGLYWWWSLGRDENWPEIQLFDTFFLSMAVFYLAGRLAYVTTHYGEIGGLMGALSLLSSPGINYHVGFVAGVIVAWRFAKIKGWDIWKVWDAMVVSISLMIFFGSIGILLNRGQMPRDALLVAWSLFSFGIVTVVRKNFRFYSWYKGESSVAKEGLATLVWIGLVSLYHVVIGGLTGNWMLLGGSILVLFIPIISVVRRSGGAEEGVVQLLRSKFSRVRVQTRKKRR